MYILLALRSARPALVHYTLVFIVCRVGKKIPWGHGNYQL